jgi:hypothetical protein
MPPLPLKGRSNQKLNHTQRINVSTPTTSETNERSITKPLPNKRTNHSQMVGARKKRKMIKSEASPKDASISKHSCSGYVTLLDSYMMNTMAPPASTVSPTEKLVPNLCHQNCHIARWTTWLKETPRVFISVLILDYVKLGQGTNEHKLSPNHLLSQQLPHICIPRLTQWSIIL